MSEFKINKIDRKSGLNNNNSSNNSSNSDCRHTDSDNIDSNNIDSDNIDSDNIDNINNKININSIDKMNKPSIKCKCNKKALRIEVKKFGKDHRNQW